MSPLVLADLRLRRCFDPQVDRGSHRTHRLLEHPAVDRNRNDDAQFVVEILGEPAQELCAVKPGISKDLAYDSACPC